MIAPKKTSPSVFISVSNAITVMVTDRVHKQEFIITANKIHRNDLIMLNEGKSNTNILIYRDYLVLFDAGLNTVSLVTNCYTSIPITLFLRMSTLKNSEFKVFTRSE